MALKRSQQRKLGAMGKLKTFSVTGEVKDKFLGMIITTTPIKAKTEADAKIKFEKQFPSSEGILEIRREKE